MKLRDIPVLLAMFASTALTSCGITSQVSKDGSFKKEAYKNQVGSNGVRRMAEVSNHDIESATKKIGAQGWNFQRSNEHPNDGYIYSRSVELSKKQEIFFRKHLSTGRMDAVSLDPHAREQMEASPISVREDIKRTDFKDASVEPLFNEAEALAAQLGPTVTAYPRPGIR